MPAVWYFCLMARSSCGPSKGNEYRTKAVILANGLSYRKLMAPGVRELLNSGIQYGAPTFNPRQLGSCTICVVGGANSAGQAILHLAQNQDATIKVLVRGSQGIKQTMSKYLVDRITAAPNVEGVAGFRSSKRKVVANLSDSLSKISIVVVQRLPLNIFVSSSVQCRKLNGCRQN